MWYWIVTMTALNARLCFSRRRRCSLIPFLFFLRSFIRCKNCKLLAPALKQIEAEYGPPVNFVMINGDKAEAWPMIEAFGVDAIPHLALVEADGTVDTALIGPVPTQWLERDLDVLIANAKKMDTAKQLQLQELQLGGGNGGTATMTAASTSTMEPRQSLPYQMLDVFANRPDQRRIQFTIQE
jgi:thioredoxin-like negative regulator of GroEL